MTSFGRQFGVTAATYDRVRPGYPDALFEMLAQAIPAGGSVLDVGAGTGIATRELLRRGLRVTALEPDGDMARQLIARSAGEVDVVTNDFEHYRGPRRAFDGVVCAQAWHWFAGPLALRRVRRLLSRNGVFAAWWNVGTITDAQLARELAVIFQETSHRLPVLFRRPDLTATIGNLARLLQGDLGFAPPEALHFVSSLTYEPGDFVALMSTMSEVLALSSEDRDHVLDRLGACLGDATVEVEYLTLGYLAIRC
ncbi:class I SAM-dependent methyltransferase [Ferrimicrobium sp.]|uniref:class I SAM-dependent methyltransferase n=1 Tax=Ferrimicrobium sp. TaxID=2926050 RepID=UPI00261FA024|nr:class I SAM-dependent methyltransferase [Ferrimicrobium sp.]